VTRLLRFSSLFAAVAALVLTAFAPAASAAAVATLQATPTSATTGSSVTVTGTGWPARANVVLTWDGGTSGIAQVRANRYGKFSTAVTIPSSAAAGGHTLAARAGSVSASVSLTVQAPAPAPAPTPAPGGTLQTRVHELVNAERARVGVAPLTVHSALTNAAQSYAELMAGTNCFSHTCGSVPNFADRITAAGYTGWRTVAENIAYGYTTPEAVVSGWMNSSGHRANILNSAFKETGIGVKADPNGRLYWVQEFGTRW